MENLQSADPSAVGVFRVNSSTTASVNDAGEVTIRQVRKIARPRETAADPRDPAAVGIATAGRIHVDELEVIVKLAAVDFAKVGRMVGALHGSDS